MPRAATTREKRPSAPKKRPLFAPWLKNSVRRRWARILFVLLLLADAALLFLDLDRYPYLLSEALGRGAILCSGLATLALVYLIARAMQTSRDVGLWAMALLGFNVPWLALLHRGDPPDALLPCAVALAALGYLRVLFGFRFGWPALGLGLGAALALNPLGGLAALLAVALHAAWWVRERAVALRLAKAAGLMAACVAAGWAWRPLLPLHATGGSWAGAGSHLLNLLAWALPLLALPLLALTLVVVHHGRRRLHREAVFFALLILCAVLSGLGCAGTACLPHSIGVAAVSAVWLALGIDALQARTPAWVWAPVGLLLVFTAVPQFAVNRAVALAGWSVRTAPSRLLASYGSAEDRAGRQEHWGWAPLYAYLRRTTGAEERYLQTEEITRSAPR